jgi:aldose 1-epimerase
MPLPAIITLQAGALRLEVAPSLGGALLGLWCDGLPLLRPTPAAALATESVRDCACYPLIPFSNRIAGGRFTFDGIDYDLPRDQRDQRHALHGTAYAAPWNIQSVGPDSLHLTQSYRPGAKPCWPFAFSAWQIVRLKPDALIIHIGMRNEHAGPAPAGIGLHPYFMRRSGMRLRFLAQCRWLKNEAMIPYARTAIDGAYDHGSSRTIGALALDDCFAGWQRSATLDDPETRLQMVLRASSALDHLIVYTPPDGTSIALEPVSHRPDAINSPVMNDVGAMACLRSNAILRGAVAIGIRRF